MFNLKVFLLFLVCISAVCEISKAQVENFPKILETDKSELSITMKRTSCFDFCPVYDLDIQPNGKVIFEGIQNTKIQGKIEGALSKEKMNQLVNEIKAADFFALKDSYVKSHCPFVVEIHNPTVILSIRLNGKEQIITHYLGCRENYKIGEPWKVFPQQLYNLENKIDEIVETKRWIGERK